MKNTCLLLVMILASFSCTTGNTKNEVLANGKINPELKTRISTLDNLVYRYMSLNKFDSLSNMFTDSMKEKITPDFAQKFMPQIQRVIKDRKFRVFDQFYISHQKLNDTVKLSGGKNEGAYKMNFLSQANESVISMLVAGDTTNEVMLTIVYNNVNGKWQVSNIRGEDYSLQGRDAIQQYHYAHALEQQGYLIDAINFMSLANYCGTPGGASFRYDKAPEIVRFEDSLSKVVREKFPLPYPVDYVATKPKIINIQMQVYEHVFTPMVVYQSSIFVADTVMLKKENDEMHGKIGSLFFGIDKNNPTILYRAYNDLPDGKNSPRYFGFIRQVK